MDGIKKAKRVKGSKVEKLYRPPGAGSKGSGQSKTVVAASYTPNMYEIYKEGGIAAAKRNRGLNKGGGSKTTHSDVNFKDSQAEKIYSKFK